MVIEIDLLMGGTTMKEISAGGVVYRNIGNRLHIQLIRDRFGKVTLAKGKMEAGETIPQTALREIEEETGIAGSIVSPLETVFYEYTQGNGERVEKEVHYFLVEAASGELQAQIEEISGVEWLEPLEAWKSMLKAGYDNNYAVLQKALHTLGFEVESQ
jgi:8-oxo-dGTP pyrophosphatase MutT (NUDIX family)